MNGRDGSDKPLSLGERIDLELYLHRDRDAAPSQLAARDTAVARRIGAGSLDGTALYRAWLGQVSRGDSVGRRIEQAVEIVSALLAIIGAMVGASLVWGWLAVESGRPVNVLHFWTVVVGLQLLLFAAVLLAMLPPRWLAWLPGFTLARSAVGVIESAAPAAVAFVVSRFSPTLRQTLQRDGAAIRKLDRLYGRLKLLLAGRMMQVFAIAFNVGALAALVLVGHVTDAAFGWRSTLMHAERLHSLVTVIASPWSWLFPAAAPSYEQIVATQYTLLEERYAASAGQHPHAPSIWAAWFPFLVASIVTYGLIARSLLLALIEWRYSRLIRNLPLDHVDVLRLRERLKPLQSSDHDELLNSAASLFQPSHVGADPLTERSVWLLVWSGGKVESGHTPKLLPPGALLRGTLDVGDVDPAHDAAALDAVSVDDDTAVVLAVPAWEPPVADHLDFLRQLRTRVGPRRHLRVVVFRRGESASPVPAGPRELAIWSRRLDGLADAYLSVATVGGGATSE